jgi:uncharacterized SAM-binding protein YcdF (DUF218 family)
MTDRRNDDWPAIATPAIPTVDRSDIPLATPQRRRRGRVVPLLLIAGIVAFAAGFFVYASSVPTASVPFERNADGIVALTGGPDRIADAVELLAAGRGKRLLITGVNPATKMEELARQLPRYEKQFSCCIDLDHSALNTIGNAVETRRWAREKHFHSLVVVTSRFHMLRALAELQHQLPDVEMIPYPVVSDRARVEPWWSNFTTARVLAFEYIKYLAATVRMRFDWIVAVRATRRDPYTA